MNHRTKVLMEGILTPSFLHYRSHSNLKKPKDGAPKTVSGAGRPPLSTTSTNVINSPGGFARASTSQSPQILAGPSNVGN